MSFISKSKMVFTPFLIVTFFLISCDTNREPADQPNCTGVELNKSLKYEDLILGIDTELLRKTTEQPDQNGALSKNKEEYFSVRFQMDMSKLIDYAIIHKRIDAVQEFTKSLAYAFSYQNPDGSYQMILPDELVNDPNIGMPTKGDSVSAIAFFSYGLGLSLNTLQTSEWFTESNETEDIRNEIKTYLPNIESTLSYLMDKEDILRQVDAQAPNRLLFDAIAYYSLGKYTDNANAQSIGLEFMREAMALRDKEEGYFIEAGGWDSSYNGVAIKLGLEMFTMLPPTHPLKHSLENQLACATSWQVSRVMENGEITTEGNTRVYPGGESFLGNEKEVDVEKTVRAFYYFAVLTDDKAHKELADRILDYYQ